MPLKFIEGEEWWEVLVYQNPYLSARAGYEKMLYEIPQETLDRWNEGFKAFFALQREMAKLVTGHDRLPFQLSAGPGGPDDAGDKEY